MQFYYQCYECGFQGWVSEIEPRKVQCPFCLTKNDVWLEEETPPSKHKN